MDMVYQVGVQLLHSASHDSTIQHADCATKDVHVQSVHEAQPRCAYDVLYHRPGIDYLLLSAALACCSALQIKLQMKPGAFGHTG